MARHEVDLAGSVGLVTDVLPSKLDKNVWTTLKNGSARDTSVGVQEFFSRLSLFPRAAIVDEDAVSLLANFQTQEYAESEEWPFFYYPTREEGVVLAVFSFIFVDQEVFVFCTQRRVYTQDSGGVINDVTPDGVDFSTNINRGWTGTVFGGILILNNGVDEPIFWMPTVEDQLATKARFLSEAPGDEPWPAGWSCRVLTGFKNALFAMNIQDDTGVRYPYLVKFSDFAEPGTLPRTWIAAPDNSAGDQDIADDFGSIVDALAFRDVLITWKERSCYGFRYVGGNDVYQRFTISTETGLLARNCIVNTDDFQVAITTDDLVVCDGNQIRSLAHQRVRRSFFRDLDSSMFQRSFLFHNSANSELWFFKPTTGNDFCNMAVVYDYRNNTFVEKEFVGATGAVNSFRVIQDDITWDEALEIWNDTERVWSAPFLGETTERVMISLAEIVGQDAQENLLYRSTMLVRGQGLFEGPGDEFPFVAERLSVPLPRGDKVDWASQKQVQYVEPKLEMMELADDFRMRVWVGFQWGQNDSIRWVGPKEWTPGRKRLFFHGAGRFISVRFEVDPGQRFEMSGYDIEYKLVSRYS